MTALQCCNSSVRLVMIESSSRKEHLESVLIFLKLQFMTYRQVKPSFSINNVVM